MVNLNITLLNSFLGILVIQRLYDIILFAKVLVGDIINLYNDFDPWRVAARWIFVNKLIGHFIFIIIDVLVCCILYINYDWNNDENKMKQLVQDICKDNHMEQEQCSLNSSKLVIMIMLMIIFMNIVIIMISSFIKQIIGDFFLDELEFYVHGRGGRKKKNNSKKMVKVEHKNKESNWENTIKNRNSEGNVVSRFGIPLKEFCSKARGAITYGSDVIVKNSLLAFDYIGNRFFVERAEEPIVQHPIVVNDDGCVSEISEPIENIVQHNKTIADFEGLDKQIYWDHDPRNIDWLGDWNKLKDHFIYAKFPNMKCTFKINELPEIMDKYMLHDPLGSPFCGLTAIDLCSGHVPDISRYLRMARHYNNILDTGSNVNLKKHAYHRGYNLRFIVDYADEETQIIDYCNDVSWKFICLVVRNSDGEKLFNGQLHDNDIMKHVFIATHNTNDYCNIQPIEPFYGEFGWSLLLRSLVISVIELGIVYFIYFFFFYFIPYISVDSPWENEIQNFKRIFEPILMALSWLDELFIVGHLIYKFLVLESRIVYKKTWYDESNDDVRTIIERREKIESYDKYFEYEETFGIYMMGITLLELKYFFPPKSYLVSAIKLNQILRECSLLDPKDFDTAINSALMMNISNTNYNQINLLRDTRKVSQYLLRNNNLGLDKSSIKTKAFDDLGLKSYLPSLNYILLNQLLFTCGYQCANGFKSLRKELTELRVGDLKQRVVAYNCLFNFYNEHGTVSPGLLCNTNPFSMFAAAIGRSMSGKNELNSYTKKFLNICKEEINRLTEVIKIRYREKNEIEVFENNQHGKKSQSLIDSIIQAYKDIISRRGTVKKNLRHSGFVKFEDNTKIVNGRPIVRPRMIMTMDVERSVNLSNMVPFMDEICHGYLKQFMAKGMDVEEFSYHISKFTSYEHCVTDYSHFEADVTEIIRQELENKLLVNLMNKTYMPNTIREYIKLDCAQSRKLYLRCGVFNIASRCSGSYHTSFGNFIVNYMLNYYNYVLNGCEGKYKGIYEGDDGLIPYSIANPKTINELGFEFSDNTYGVKPGDVDFLRRRWIKGKCYLNIGRVIKQLSWVKSQTYLHDVATKKILRCMAYSIEYMSPGHPILQVICNKIFLETNHFKLSGRFLKKFEQKMGRVFMKTNFSEINSLKGYTPVDESMRHWINYGTKDFPRIPIQCQIDFENSIRNDKNIYIPKIISNYSDLINSQKCDHIFERQPLEVSEQMKESIHLIDSIIKNKDNLNSIKFPAAFISFMEQFEGDTLEAKLALIIKEKIKLSGEIQGKK